MKIEVKHISLKSYFELPYEDRKPVEFNLNYGEFKANDLFGFGSFIELPFGFVKDIQDIMNTTGLNWQKYIEEVSKFKQIDKKEIAKESIYKLFESKLYFKEQIIIINTLENQLSYNPTVKEEVSGIDNFAKYRSFIQFDKLANGDVTKFEQIRSLQYGLCFTKLLLEKEKTEFEQKLLKKN